MAAGRLTMGVKCVKMRLLENQWLILRESRTVVLTTQRAEELGDRHTSLLGQSVHLILGASG